MACYLPSLACFYQPDGVQALDRAKTALLRECCSRLAQPLLGSAHGYGSLFLESVGVPALHTTRLDLEPITVHHAQEAWPHLDDPRMWEFFPKLRPASLERLQQTYATWENPNHVKSEVRENWACRDRQSGSLVGTMQATTFPAQAISYIAYGIFVAFQRSGYAREAAAAVIEHVASNFESRRVFAEMDVKNEASFRLAESLGFRRMKTRHTIDSDRGIDADEYLYELVLP